MSILSKLICLTSFVLILTGCANLNNNQAIVNAGQVTTVQQGTHYQNPLLGLSLTFPQNWHVVTGQQFAERIKQGNAPSVFITSTSQQRCEKALFCALKSSQAITNRSLVLLNLLPPCPGGVIKNSATFTQILKDELGKKMTIETAPTVQISGQPFIHLVASRALNEQVIIEDLYFTDCHNHTLYLIFGNNSKTLHTDNQTILNSLQFQKASGDNS